MVAVDAPVEHSLDRLADGEQVVCDLLGAHRTAANLVQDVEGLRLRKDEGEMLARDFFERLHTMGDQERYVQYVRGDDDDDD
jgi:hypothetical protein